MKEASKERGEPIRAIDPPRPTPAHRRRNYDGVQGPEFLGGGPNPFLNFLSIDIIASFLASFFFSLHKLLVSTFSMSKTFNHLLNFASMATKTVLILLSFSLFFFFSAFLFFLFCFMVVVLMKMGRKTDLLSTRRETNKKKSDRILKIDKAE